MSAFSRQTVAESALAVVTGRAAWMAAGMLIYVVLGRGLGASGTGLYSLTVAVYGVALVFSRLGLDSGAIRLVASKTAVGDRDGAAATAGAVLFGGLALGLAVGAVLFVAAPQLGRLFSAPALAMQLRIVAVGLPLGSAAMVATGAMQGAARIGYGVWSREVLQQWLTAGAILAIVWVPALHGSPPAMAIALPALVVGALVAWRTVGFFGLRKNALHHLKGAAIAEVLRFSRPFAMNTAVGTATLMSHTLIIGYFLDVADLGRYSSAARVVRLMPFGLVAAGHVFMPVASALYANADRRRLEIAYRASARWGWHFGAPLAAVLLVRPELVLSLFGHEFAGAATVLRILAAGQLVNLATGACGPMLLMTSHQLVELRNTVTSAVLGVLLCVVLVQWLGVAGAGVAAALTMALVNVARVLQVRRLIGIMPFSAGLWRAALAAAVAACALVALPSPAAWPLLLRLVEQCGLVLVVYIGTVMLLGPDPDDFQMLANLARRAVRASSEDV